MNLALPAIRNGVHASAAQLQLIVSVYTSAFAVFLVTGGRLGDLLGRKRLFMTGMAGFVAASLGCALATSGTMLVCARLLQGVSAAMLVPQALAAIRGTFPPAQQTKVIGLYGFVYGSSHWPLQCRLARQGLRTKARTNKRRSGRTRSAGQVCSRLGLA